MTCENEPAIATFANELKQGHHAVPSLIRGCFECDAFGFVAVCDPLIRFNAVDVVNNQFRYKAYLDEWGALLALGYVPDSEGFVFAVCPFCNGTRFASWVVSLGRLVTFPLRGFKPSILFDVFATPSHPINRLQMWWFLSYRHELTRFWRDVTEEYTCWKLSLSTKSKTKKKKNKKT